MSLREASQTIGSLGSSTYGVDVAVFRAGDFINGQLDGNGFLASGFWVPLSLLFKNNKAGLLFLSSMWYLFVTEQPSCTIPHIPGPEFLSPKEEELAI